MKVQTTLFVLEFMLVTSLTSPAFGQTTVLYQHSGANNPTNEGFRIGGLLPVGAYNEAGPVYGDYGVDAWSTTGLFAYSHTLARPALAMVAAHDWTLSVSLRSADAASDAFIRFGNGQTTPFPPGPPEDFSLRFGLTRDGDPFVEAVKFHQVHLTHVLNGASPGYHNYQLKSLQGTLSLWVDDTAVWSSIPTTIGLSQLEFFSWGTSSPGHGTAHWNLISFQVVPEPATLAFLLCGSAFWLAARGRQHRRYWASSVRNENAP